MNITNVLTEIEKHAILTNEYEFVKTLIPENVKIYKIPRVIYDLFAIHFFTDTDNYFVCYLDECNHMYNDEKTNNITCNTYDSYCNQINTYHHSQLEHIFELNNYIITYLKNKNINYKTPTYVDYMAVLHDNTLIEGDEFLNNKLLIDTLLAETTQTYNRDKIMLYRGSADAFESAIDGTKPNFGFSVSYNTSLLNGCIFDPTACSYNYMETGNFKHAYILNKFWYGDGGVEDNLFFIPPLHPYLQIFGYGELWHARSKIYKLSVISRVDGLKGVVKVDGLDADDAVVRVVDGVVEVVKVDGADGADGADKVDADNANDKDILTTTTVRTFSDKEFLPKSFPDFLRSRYNREEINERFKLFIAKHRAQIGAHRVKLERQKNETTAEFARRIRENYAKEMAHHVEENLFGGRKTKRKLNRKTKRKTTKCKTTKCKTTKRKTTKRKTTKRKQTIH